MDNDDIILKAQKVGTAYWHDNQFNTCRQI